MTKTLNMLSITEIVAALQHDGVGVLPTDTVYGLVCSAHSPRAIARVYALKQREQKPGTVIAASVEQLVSLGIPLRYLKPVAHFWPNPISVVVPMGPEHAELHMGKYSLACRIPNDAALLKLLEQTGPLLTSSANLTGKPPATNHAEAQAYFCDEVDFYVDGGDLADSKPSTIIRIVDDAIEVLREGAVTVTERGEIQ